MQKRRYTMWLAATSYGLTDNGLVRGILHYWRELYRAAMGQTAPLLFLLHSRASVDYDLLGPLSVEQFNQFPVELLYFRAVALVGEELAGESHLAGREDELDLFVVTTTTSGLYCEHPADVGADRHGAPVRLNAITRLQLICHEYHGAVLVQGGQGLDQAAHRGLGIVDVILHSKLRTKILHGENSDVIQYCRQIVGFYFVL